MKRALNLSALILVSLLLGCDHQSETLAIQLGAPGEFFLDGEKVSFDELGKKLEKVAKINQEASFTIEAQEQSLGSEFVAVLKLIEENGFTQVAVKDLGSEKPLEESSFDH